VVSGFGRLVLAVTEMSSVRSVLADSAPGRRLSHRFVAGETLDQAAAAVRTLNEAGLRVSLDHLGEHVTAAAEALGARDDYLAALERIERDDLDANISIKLTQLGLSIDPHLAAEYLDDLASRAAEIGTSVTVDMEESEHTTATIAVYREVQKRRRNVGIAVQAYLFRTRDDLDAIIPLGGHVRLCKGAYAEPPDIAYQSRSDVDASFDRLATLLMGAEGVRVAIASHDEQRITHARSLAKDRAGYHEFQLLYGVRGPLQRELLDDGLTVRVYLPYGVAWYPYLTRRLAERPANLWFFLRALIGGR
jgi:proline dehydrogenase